jgi:DNA-binding NtrC family response regulator
MVSPAAQHADSARNRIARSALPKYDIVLLSTDAALRAALQGAVGREITLWCVSSAQNAVGTLIAGRCAVFIADLRHVSREHGTLFEKLKEQFPDLVLLAAGTRQEERLAHSLLSSGLVYRFLHTPVSQARAASFVAGALRRHEELKALQTTMLSTMKVLVSKPR